MATWAEWTASSRRVAITTRGGKTWRVSVRAAPGADAGATRVTLLHGFPTHSLDWAKVTDRLVPRVACTTLDFLGFGASDKPVDHDYTLHEQADLVEGV